MDLNEYKRPRNLEKYSFLWSEARLVLAAIALFIGGVPLISAINPIYALSGLFSTLLGLAWIISGLVSVYMLYRWNQDGKTLFGKKDMNDKLAFFVSVISGLNLGITGVFGTNIGMTISSSKMIFIITGIIYLAAAYRLYQRWNESGKRIFQ